MHNELIESWMGHKSLTDAPFPEGHAFSKSGRFVIRNFPFSHVRADKTRIHGKTDLLR